MGKVIFRATSEAGRAIGKRYLLLYILPPSFRRPSPPPSYLPRPYHRSFRTSLPPSSSLSPSFIDRAFPRFSFPLLSHLFLHVIDDLPSLFLPPFLWGELARLPRRCGGEGRGGRGGRRGLKGDIGGGAG